MDFKKTTVVIPESSSPVLEFAAEELKKFLFKITGKDLKIQRNRAAGKIISLGKTSELTDAAFKVNYSLLGGDGFFIEENEKGVFIDGNFDRSVLFGVYDLLEYYFGVRFFSADTTFVPQSDGVVKDRICRFEIPAVEHRAYMSGDCFGEYADLDFMARSRTENPFTRTEEKYGNRPWIFGRNNSTHNMNFYVPFEKYGRTHPEFFYIKGVDPAEGYNDDGTGNSPDLTICLTNGLTEDGKLDESMDESVLKTVIEEMKKDIVSHPDVKYFCFEQEDLSYGCECEKCMAAEKKYTRSGMLIRFCNVVAKELKKFAEEELGGREIYVVTFAYAYTADAPVRELDGERKPIDDTVIPCDNLVMRLAIHGNAFYDLFSEKQDKRTYNQMRDWWNLGKSFMFWGYDIGFDCVLWYWPTAKNIKANVEGLTSKNLIYVQYENETKNNWQSAMRGYVYNKLFWNPKLDADALLDEFTFHDFGEYAAPYVKKFMQVYEDFYAKVIDERQIYFAMMHNYREPYTLDIDVIEKTLNIIDEADKITREKEESGELKELHLKHIANVKCSSLFCKYKGFEYYFPDADKESKRVFAKQFIKLCRYAGLLGYHAQHELYSFERLEKEDYELPY